MVVGGESEKSLFSFHLAWLPEIGLKSPGLQGKCLQRDEVSS